jgi:two-component system NtrC family sensor kinase
MRLDADGDLEVIEANHAAERLLSLHGLATGPRMTAQVFSRLPKPLADRFAEIALTGESWERRDIALDASGFHPTTCDIYAFQTAPGEMAAVVLDASDRAEAQRALVVSERAAAVGTLVSGIAHRFNNINVGILGYADLLLSYPGMDEAHRKKLERIREAALQGRDITGQLLALAQNSSSERHPTSVNEVVADMVNMLRHTLEAEGIDIELRAAETPRLWLDGSELSQVILALVTNAQHAVMGQEKRHILVEVGVEDVHVCVHISDTGCGIAPGDLDRIFMPFYTTKGEHAPHTSLQVRVKGAGLGLSVADAIVRQYSGSITVDSEPGYGSTFTLWLPIPANGRGAA